MASTQEKLNEANQQISDLQDQLNVLQTGKDYLSQGATNFAANLPEKAQVGISMTRLAPYQEGFQKDIFRAARDLARNPIMTPDRQVAGFDPLQQRAIELGAAGIGAYQPLLNEAAAGTRAAQGQGLRAEGMYDPSMTQQFMDPFQQEVIDASLRDISRAGEMERQKLADAAVGAGAFGGSRDALLQAEQYRGQMQQMADTAARLRSAGFQQAQQAGMGAFEAARSRDLGIAGLLGQTAGQTATLATQGQAQAGQDIATLQGLGAMGQQQQQSVFDAQRATELERLYEPYKRVSYMADIMGGTPSTQSTMTAGPPPQSNEPSRSSQLIGLGIAGLGAMGGFNYNPFQTQR